MHTCETVRLEGGRNEYSLKSKLIELGYWHLNCDLESQCLLLFSSFAEWSFFLSCYCFDAVAVALVTLKQKRTS